MTVKGTDLHRRNRWVGNHLELFLKKKDKRFQVVTNHRCEAATTEKTKNCAFSALALRWGLAAREQGRKNQS
jgi:hypothetical protein